MGRYKSRKPNLVLVNGDHRVVLSYRHGTVTFTSPTECRIFEMAAMKHLTFELVERAYMAWGYTMEEKQRRAA